MEELQLILRFPCYKVTQVKHLKRSRGYIYIHTCVYVLVHILYIYAHLAIPELLYPSYLKCQICDCRSILGVQTSLHMTIGPAIIACNCNSKKKKKTSELEMGKWPEQTLFQRRIWIASRYIKSCSTSLIIWECKLNPLEISPHTCLNDHHQKDKW